MPRGFWKSSPQKAAVDYARKNLDEKSRGETTVKKDAESLTSGMIEYGGHSNVYGMSNQLVRFGKRADVCKISFSYGFMRRGNFEGDHLASCLVSLEPASERAEFIALVASEFRNVDVAIDDRDNAILYDSYACYNPPTIFNGLKVYDGKRAIIFDEDSENIRIGIKRKLRFTKYVNALMLKQKKVLFPDKRERFDPYSIEKKALREQLIQDARMIINDPMMPFSLKSDLLKGARYFCLHELKSDIVNLSRRHSKKKDYVREYEKQSKRYSGLDYSYEKVSKSASYKRYSKLLSRYFNDDEQQLRKEIDMTLASLNAVGDVAAIRKMISDRKETAHLLYHLYRTHLKNYQLLTLTKLKLAETAYDRRLLLMALTKHAPDQLLEYLSKASDLEFTKCAALSADLIREKKPEWKLRLQIALVNYHRVVKDRGYWPLDGLEAIVPDDAPHYFDDQVVASLISDLEKSLDQFTSQYCNRESFQERIDLVKKRWEK
jgi:hypothetical protein